MKRLAIPLVLLLAVGLALALTAGDGKSTGTADAPGPPVPALSVARLEGGGEFELAQLASAKTPTLLWFWAPWCDVCNHEARAIERLAASGRGELHVVAIGGRDEVANGPPFVTRHRLRTPTVLFDEPMKAWEAYHIPGQPAAVLLDRSGRERGRWLGPINNAEVLDAARAL